MESCGYCPVTPEDFEKTPPFGGVNTPLGGVNTPLERVNTPPNPIYTTQFVTFPCGHSFHTQCIFNRILQDKFCTVYGDIHLDSIVCTHCQAPPVPQESLRFYHPFLAKQ